MLAENRVWSIYNQSVNTEFELSLGGCKVDTEMCNSMNNTFNFKKTRNHNFYNRQTKTKTKSK